ncbi:hypothetical protein V4T56_004190 [Vibrio vulnificus]|nr:hypothetical protein [Vibrio vulnificus]EIY9463291.1 hypothetical protein [Vibrio vulnificus]EIZ1354365.1 hypothetical protein [Vibrio vulnificus]
MKILYSVNTWLAYKISEIYYRDTHYVWCAPSFNTNGDNPPSSDPATIYSTLANDVKGMDKHSAKISQNRTGLLKSAEIKLKDGTITEAQHKEIIEITNNAELQDFRPLIYAIPHNLVEGDVKPASIKIKANYFSKEFIIESLKRDQFDIIDILGKQ